MRLAPERAEPVPGLEPPAPGTAVPVAEGVRWIRMPLPFALNHVNLWLIEDGPGWTLVDTGYGLPATLDHWDRLLADLEGPVTRILVTHGHPDHVGLAAWLQARTGAPIHMTLGEYFGAQFFWRGLERGWKEEALEHFRRHGLGEEALEALRTSPDTYRAGVPDLPRTFERLVEGDSLGLGGRTWTVRVGHGHSPEHASFLCEAAGILISGDMVLPSITTNISVSALAPGEDALARYLASLRRLRDLPEDLLVLPSHGRPFRGLQARLDALEAHHAERLRLLEAACREPRSAADILKALFGRALDSHQMVFAMGEAIAHLNHLERQGRLRQTLQEDGILRFQAAPGRSAP